MLNPQIVSELQAAAGPGGWLDDPAQMEPYVTEWRGLYRGETPLVLFPASTAAVAAVLTVCQRHRIGVVPQGGNTGLVGGAIPRPKGGRPEIVLATRRLRRIRALDPSNFTITAEAGCVLAEIQAAAAAADRLFPLSLAAEGSCQLGGNISTNAGGTAVLRFGPMRDLVLGLEVVLPDGRIFDGLRALRKDNTGYDLKQLFIGAEGTLGVVTAATCKLFPRFRDQATAIVAVGDPALAVSLFGAARAHLGDDLVAFELLNRLSVELVVRHIPGTRDPLDGAAAWYVLLETATARQGDASAPVLEAFLARALEAGLVSDGVLARSESDRAAFWRVRHEVSAAQKSAGASIKHDISVPVAAVPAFLTAAGEMVARLMPGAAVVAFGHLGDGNIHFNVGQGSLADAAAFLARWDEISHAVHAVAMDLGGSFSAEHGVGVMKRADLAEWRGGVTLDLMRSIKTALDPAGIMNPGKLLPD